MDKTITVRVERLVTHPKFGKILRRHYVCYAHDDKNEAVKGDKVELAETRPLSKLKRWRLVRVVDRAAVARPAPSEAPAPS
jgi:small subunit ribosomal protein S17